MSGTTSATISRSARPAASGAAAVRTLVAWWEQRVVGALALDRHGAMRFAYDEDWLCDDAAPPLSLSLPKRSKSFSHRRCAPFFEGLLPEGSERDAVAGALGVSPDHAFGILAGIGGEVAGAVSLWPEGEAPPGPTLDPLATPDPLAPAHAATPAEPLSDSDLVRVLDEIRTRPLLANGEGGLRLSLAGAQSKLPVVEVDGQIALPPPGGPTSHILKPAGERFPAITENEAFAMRLARRLGLSAAAVEPRVVKGRPFLLVKRYDRDRWGRFAERCEVDSAAVGPRIAELCSMAVQHCDAVAEELAKPGLDHAALLDFADRVRRRAAVLERSA